MLRLKVQFQPVTFAEVSPNWSLLILNHKTLPFGLTWTSIVKTSKTLQFWLLCRRPVNAELTSFGYAFAHCETAAVHLVELIKDEVSDWLQCLCHTLSVPESHCVTPHVGYYCLQGKSKTSHINVTVPVTEEEEYYSVCESSCVITVLHGSSRVIIRGDRSLGSETASVTEGLWYKVWAGSFKRRLCLPRRKHQTKSSVGGISVLL